MQAKVAESEARAQSAEMKLAEMERRLAIAEGAVWQIPFFLIFILSFECDCNDTFKLTWPKP